MCVINPFNPFGVATGGFLDNQSRRIEQPMWKHTVTPLPKSALERVLEALNEVTPEERKRIMAAASAYFEELK